MSTKKIFPIISVLSVLGIILAVYLLYQQFFRPAFQPCYVNSFINCEAVISGAVAKTLGIPTPLFGLIGYIIIFLSALKKNKKLLLAMSTFGLGFCLWIGYREIFELHVLCPICIVCQLIMISVFCSSIIINRHKD